MSSGLEAGLVAHPAPPSALDVLIADRDAIDATIISLRHRIANSSGRVPSELGRYLDAAVARQAEVVAEIAAMGEGR